MDFDNECCHSKAMAAFQAADEDYNIRNVRGTNVPKEAPLTEAVINGHQKAVMEIFESGKEDRFHDKRLSRIARAERMAQWKKR